MGSKDSGYLVCKKCGGAYKLQQGESPGDFSSCECGGKLKFKNNIGTTKSTETAKILQDKAMGWFNKLSFKGKAVMGLGGIVIIALIFVSASGLFSVAGNEFENDYVKFKVPNGLNVTDDSTNDHVDISIFNGSKLVGNMHPGRMTSDVFNSASEGEKKISIAGKEALEFSMDDQIQIFVHISDGGNVINSKNYLGLELNFWDTTLYNTIKNSLVIKKNPQDQ